MPQMLPVTFTMLKRVFELDGYKIDMLTTTHRGIVDTGLRYVHNDTCYPALLVIGQLLEAVNSGHYDKHKVGLLITQTGGGCRASNYIHLLRKALGQSGALLHSRRLGQPVGTGKKSRFFADASNDPEACFRHALRRSPCLAGQPVPAL